MHGGVPGHDLPGRGIRATNVKGCFNVPIVEWVIAMMVNLARDMRQMVRNPEATIGRSLRSTSNARSAA